MFRFQNYSFDQQRGLASFNYEGPTGIQFTETVEFTIPESTFYNSKTLDRAMFLAFIVIGTSYYKANPTKEIQLPESIDETQAKFFSQIYQEGLSQFAFENGLKRTDLAHFAASDNAEKPVLPENSPQDHVRLVLLSGGKDSLLTAEKLYRENLPFTSVYISNNNADLPEIVSSYGKPIVIRRHLDRDNLKKAAGLNGHVPVTLINESLALIQAVLAGATEIYLGLGREGEEQHAYIDDLPVNHQWAKAPATQKSFKSYVASYVSKSIQFKSLLENQTELEIAGEFVNLCWDKYGDKFSSCNVANYKQGNNNKTLKWCGKCPKCANSFLLFAPYLPLEKQPFGHDLFLDPDLTDIFKGLLGVEGFIKPFECVGTIAELREAYKTRLPDYSKLSFLEV